MAGVLTNNFTARPSGLSMTFPRDDGVDADDGLDAELFHHAESDYEVVQELGAGLQGRVDLALDKQSQQFVAVKLPTFDLREDSKEVDLRHLDCQVQSIVQERNALRRVDHPNVVRFRRSLPGRKSRHAYVMLVMEYAGNGDLFDLIAQTGALPERACQYYMHQLLLALQACHAAGVVHRDVKPENILFDDAFTLKLCDFGLASILPPEEVYKTELNDVEGTQLYMAPEIDSGAPFRGPPVDMWACGVVLFIMLTGFPPFESAEPGDVWYNLIVGGALDEFWASQPATISKPKPLAIDLINGLLQVDASKRLTAAEALAHPWLRDVAEIDEKVMQQDMRQRRQRCVGQALGDDEDDDFEIGRL